MNIIQKAIAKFGFKSEPLVKIIDTEALLPKQPLVTIESTEPLAPKKQAESLVKIIDTEALPPSSSGEHKG